MGKMFLGEMFLEVVNSYVYFGLTFTTTMSSFQGTKQLAVKGKMSMSDTVRALKDIDNMSRQMFLMLKYN